MQPTRQERSRVSLERLVEVAMRLVRDRGFAETSVNRICSEAGLTSGAFYARFGGKAELLIALWERLEPEMSEVVARFEQSLAKRSFEESIRRLFRDVTVVYERDGNLLRELTSAASHNRDLANAMRRANERNLSLLVAAILGSGFELAHPKPELAVSLGLASTLGTLKEFALERVLFEHTNPLSSSVLTRELTRLLLSYLESR